MFKRPWLMIQEWHDVIFLHYSVSPDEVRKYVPSELELDLYNNMAWIGLVFFRVKGNRLRFIPPLPGLRSYLELNVRTYVKYKGRAGVHFFSLDANNKWIVSIASAGNLLPYRYANMSLKRHKKTVTIQTRFNKRQPFPEKLVATFGAISGPIKSQSFERWLTERYHLWSKTNDHIIRVDNSHSPWILQEVSCTIIENSMAPFLKKDFQKDEPVAHYSKKKKARFFLPVQES